jgi:hypothetical protein
MKYVAYEVDAEDGEEADLLVNDAIHGDEDALAAVEEVPNLDGDDLVIDEVIKIK